MKFNAISIIPEQEKFTTPDKFIVDQYGKLPELHGDGPLTINEAIRLSKIVSGYSPAFTSTNNQIIYGFYVEETNISLKDDGSLIIRIPPGVGIIDKLIFKIPIWIDAKWEGFSNSIPPNLQKGKVLIYFAYKDLIENYPDRPYPQNYTHYPTVVLPEDQSSWNPISICRAFYDPINKRLVNSEWDPDEKKILISGNIYFERHANGSVDMWTEEEDNGTIEVGDESYPQQGGGYVDKSTVDGGVVEKSTEADITSKFGGIHIIYNSLLRNTYDSILLDTNNSNFFVFFNGIMYKKDIDWTFDLTTHRLTFDNKVLVPNKRLFIFECVTNKLSGYLNLFYSNIITKDAPSLNIVGLTPAKQYLVFIDGLLRKDAIIEPNLLTAENIKNGGWINILEIIPGTSNQDNVNLIYDGPGQDSSLFKNAFINPIKAYLVFYNGVLYSENDDYYVRQNVLEARIPMYSTKNLTVVGV